MKKNLKLENRIFLYENPFFSKKFKKKIRNFQIKPFTELNYINKKNVIAILSKLIKKMDDKILCQFPNLRYIVSPTTGDDHIDKNYCKNKKIKIIKLEKKDLIDTKITSTIEYALTLILASVRNLYSSIDIVKNGKWDRNFLNFFQFKNYTVGIIGNGRIGSKLAKILKYLNFKVIIHDKKNKRSNLIKLYNKSDIISFHITSDKNKDFFGKKEMFQCKKNVKIINTSRGEIINEKDLKMFLSKNKKASAHLDVIADEQNQSNFFNKEILRFNKKQKNLFITSHVAGAAIDAQKLTEELVIKKFLKNYEK